MLHWKIKFTIDDGYTWHTRNCIVLAETESEALGKFENHINKVLVGEEIVLVEKTQVSLIEVVDGIVFQNYRNLQEG